ncbi:hypothetical protein D9M73_138630 [compost metagenome]
METAQFRAGGARGVDCSWRAALPVGRGSIIPLRCVINAGLVADGGPRSRLGRNTGVRGSLAVVASLSGRRRFSPLAGALDVVACDRGCGCGDRRADRRARARGRLFKHSGVARWLAYHSRRVGAVGREGDRLAGGAGLGHFWWRARAIADSGRCPGRARWSLPTWISRVLGVDRDGRDHERCDARAADRRDLRRRVDRPFQRIALHHRRIRGRLCRQRADHAAVDPDREDCSARSPHPSGIYSRSAGVPASGASDDRQSRYATRRYVDPRGRRFFQQSSRASQLSGGRSRQSIARAGFAVRRAALAGRGRSGRNVADGSAVRRITTLRLSGVADR